MWPTLACLFLVSSALSAAASNILVISPMPSQSHSNLFDPLVEELVARGHRVTFVTAFPLKNNPQGLNQIRIPNMYDAAIEIMGNASFLESRQQLQIWQMIAFPMMGAHFTDKLLEQEGVKSLLASNEKFELLISEAHLIDALIAGVTQRFKVPFVGICTFIANPWANYMVGNPTYPSYIPNYAQGLGTRMNFVERMQNFLWHLGTDLIYALWVQPTHARIFRKHFGDDLLPVHKVVKNTSLVLINHHHALSFPRPYAANMIEVGGYHVRPPKPLPQNLQEYMDSAKNGVILFSLGSHIKSSIMPLEKQQALLDAFGELKENVLWKFEETHLTNVPKNVKISKWLPQSDILAHPNLKLFITHGGLLSTTESVLRGVPMVGIPIAGDQPANMKLVQDLGLGEVLQYEDISKTAVLQVVRKVLHDPKYLARVQLRSSILKDRPMSPIDTAIHWIEYVIRHKGAPHLRSAAQDLAWYQLYLLDVLAVLALAAAAVLTVQFYTARWLLRKIFKRRPTTKKPKKTN